MPLASRSMKLHGKARDTVTGQRVTVKYNEGGPELVEYAGVVAYAEASRMYVCFDGFPETEGAWVDDGDEWEWRLVETAAVPPPLPVIGAWTPGHVAGPVEKVYQRRQEAEGEAEFFVKWKSLAHIHCQWVPRSALDIDPANKQKVQRWVKAMAQLAESGGGEVNTWELESAEPSAAPESAGAFDGEPYPSDYNVVERICACRPSVQDLPPIYLVKWRGLPYVLATWETAQTLVGEQQRIREYQRCEETPSAAERKLSASGARPPRTNFKKLTASPHFKGGHALRDYQLEGLNWLLFSWYTRRSVMLADEMGLGKTIQSVAVLQHIWKEEHIRGPFLVVAPLSTLGHWQVPSPRAAPSVASGRRPRRRRRWCCVARRLAACHPVAPLPLPRVTARV